MPASVLDRALRGERLALARCVSWVADRRPDVGVWLDGLDVRRRKEPGSPRVVGLTGPPGAGKSTLVDVLVARARAEGRRVGVIAVDPSSPRTGGALLGDRLRMERHGLDDGVFVRSMASDGRLGGLAPAVAEAVDLLDAVGFDDVFVETVGIGQSEVGVASVADTVVLVLTPEAGDDVQVAKAGIHEVADVVAVNKADRPGAERLARALERERPDRAVCCVSATHEQGIDALVAAIRALDGLWAGPGRDRWDRRQADGRVARWLDIVADDARRAALAAATPSEVAALRAGRIGPWQLARSR